MPASRGPAPFRTVERAEAEEEDRRWLLVLSCGHRTYDPIRERSGRRKPPRTRVRCGECATEAAAAPSLFDPPEVSRGT